ncbi:amylo-alpha-1,6-glucosidase [Fundicoccus ignavus]|uniref:Mannosylglycerate hydrolase MGH1-like glycoside hydrolase domain-containing protein n=1 Tax=Fundicoccus ignavus TaxID=2664442 RepID=A0A844CHL3_9LACT|nr:trehalase family glycosidase [Fundicoccus ignavus]MRJ47195.1 hypothetical protein [Fundicoccus ignavus]
MRIDITKIPFSRFGSYFVISCIEKEFWLRDVRGGDEAPSQLFKLIFDQPVDYHCTETQLTIYHKNYPTAKVEFIMPEANSLHIRTTGMSVEMVADKIRYDTFNAIGNDEFEYISYKKEMKYRLSLLTGVVNVDAPWKIVGNERISLTLMPDSELHMVNYRVVLREEKSVISFEDSQVKLQDNYQIWRNKMPTSHERYQESHELATYLLWANTVSQDGLLTHDITYMSKNWMQNIWSWDNCFNAILLAEQYPALAYQQLEVFIDHQDTSGAYPDFINDKYVSYNCVKPPIHAWAYQKMMSINNYFCEPARLSVIYDSFVANTNFWLNYRMEDGLPYYTHGNDSGWDNASIFHEGFPVTAPDLSAYLIQQMDILASMAQELGKLDESSNWQRQADDLFDRFLPAFNVDGQLRAFHTYSKELVKSTSSAMLYLPIVIAYRLDKKLSSSLVQQLLSRFECRYGLATEEATSPMFKGDGYWLGPIWAPETYIFVDALNRAGYQEAAYRISEKFCEAALIGGLAENYNPHTAEGNDDLAFSWTSSVFLLLANSIMKGDSDNDK